jgi:Uma2 family endonuclease
MAVAKFGKVETKQKVADRGSVPLHSGDVLSVAEFHRRYSQHPEIKQADLVEGVVYVSSPVYIAHSKAHGQIVFWAGSYLAFTPAIHMGDNQSVRLDNDNEVQPDVCLWLDEKQGGNVQISEDGFLLGAPDLVIEVAASSASYDLYQKRRVYQRSGVREYLVLVAYEEEARWFSLQDGVFQPITAEDGVLRSRIFPGLWLNPDHIWAGDFAAMQALVQQGCQSAEHAEFIKKMKTDQK